MQYRNYKEAIEKIDWNLLQRQTRTLEKILSNFSSFTKISDIHRKDIADLWGLIEFIETLQDLHGSQREIPNSGFTKNSSR
jgi:hypothetical protein